MNRRFDPLASSCHHDAIFSLAYLRTTEEYRRTIEDPNFFEDTSFVNHEDVIFAEYYFRAHDLWNSAQRSQTPPAWAHAFDAAERRELSATGNLCSAVTPTSSETSVRPGEHRHDQARRVDAQDRPRPRQHLPQPGFRQLIPEIAGRFDPTADDGDLPITIDDIASFQVVPAWRETAWRNAERLVAVETPEQQALVAADIETYAASQAALLRSATAYGPLRSSAARDAHCATNQG